MDEVAKKQETQEQVQTMTGDLDSVKTTVHGRLGEVEEAVSNVKKSQAELWRDRRPLKLNFMMNYYCENVRTEQLIRQVYVLQPRHLSLRRKLCLRQLDLAKEAH